MFSTNNALIIHFTPIGQFFSPILPPSDSLFCQFYPLRLFSRKCYPPRTDFLETPSDKSLKLFTPQVKNKDFQYPHGQGDLTPSDKKAICFFNGIALNILVHGDIPYIVDKIDYHTHTNQVF